MQNQSTIELYLQTLVTHAVQVEFERLLPQTKQQDEERLLTLDELRDYLPDHPAKQTIYGWVNNRKILYEKYGKNLYFRKSSVDKWMANGRRLS